MACRQFVEPRRECAVTNPLTCRACGAHVLECNDGTWWCGVCGSPRDETNTVEASYLPSMREVTRDPA